MTFESIDGIYDVGSDEDWDALLPRGDGFLYPQDVEPDAILYGVSMFHQLHCVDMLRKIYIYAKNGELAAHAKDEMHTLHCLGYLRQGILCSADTTLEKLYRVERNSTKVPLMTTDGMGFTHRCRDASPLKQFLEQAFDHALDVMHENFTDELEDIRAAQEVQ